MTKYGSASALWPDRAGKRRSRLRSKGAVACIGVAAVAVLVALHSFDQLIAVSGDDVTTKTATTATSCWQDWPYVDASCREGVSTPRASVRQALRSARRAEERMGGDRSITTASVPAAPTQTTNGAGGPVAPAQAAATSSPQEVAPVTESAPAPVPVPAPAVAPTPASAAPPTPAVPAVTAAGHPPAAVAAAALSEHELTFKQGYIRRQAALGRPVEDKPGAAAKPTAHKATHAKPRKERAPAQVVELPDGRKVVVRRPYSNGGYDAARLEPPSGRFRAAENRTRGGDWFGGERRGGWFW